ncbi:MAG: tRNA lysidine(34) synthetase TilS [Spirochaetes bacterium]|nr:MAG: tRNA lysidine(34) synthetase TilS [Spirochaetota bacterium]
MENNITLKDSFIEKIDNYSLKHKLISLNDKILCAVSGGPDSVALFYVMLTLMERYKIELSVAHLEHGIRDKESLRDQEFVKSLCKRFDIPFYTKNVRISDFKKSRESIEEGARRIRLDFLKDTCEKIKYNKIATGHTFDDHIETVIFRLINGTGQKGIRGIRVSSDGIIRPLLCVTKREILDFLERHSISYMEDLTNYDVHYTRNRIRYRVIPEIKEINARYREHINNFVKLISEDDTFIEQLVDDYMNGIVRKISNSELRILSEKFYNFPPPIKKRIILRAVNNIGDFIRKFGLKNSIYLPYNVINSITEKKPQSNKILYKDKYLVISSEYEELVIKKSVVEDINTEYLYTVKEDVSEVYIQEIGRKISFTIIDKGKLGRFEADKLYFDLDKVVYPLIVRSRRPGDKINLPNLGTKKIKSIFINDKVKPLERILIPIILIGDKIAGIFCSYYGKKNRVGREFMIDENTKRVLVCCIE